MKFETKVIHAGQQPDPRTGAVMTPIYATSTYAQSSPGEHKGYDYARTRNPTRDALEACLAELEGGRVGFAFASGMAAIGTVLELLDSGAHVVAMDDLYGGSYRILERVRKRSADIQASFRRSDFRRESRKGDPAADAHGLGRDARPTRCSRSSTCEAIAEVARKRKLISVCDNTFASPWIQRPLELGFDIVVHSTTKYLNGHSDVIGGAAIIERRSGTERASLRSFRTPSAACRARSTPSSRCAASRRSPCAWSGIAATRCTSPRGSRSIRGRARHLPGPREPSAARAGERAR